MEPLEKTLQKAPNVHYGEDILAKFQKLNKVQYSRVVAQNTKNYLNETEEFSSNIAQDLCQLSNTGYFEKEIMDAKMAHKH